MCLVRLLIFKKLNAKKQKRMDIKIKLMQEVLSEAFEDLVYNPYGSIKAETVRDACLIDEWDQDTDSFDATKSFWFTGNDYFSGKYKGCEFECCDVDVTKKWTVSDTDDEGRQVQREESETSFKGLWMICRLKKPLKAMVRIREKADTPLLFKKLLGPRARAKSDVQTENIAFNEQFQILTSDSHSAFYILTPHFMEHVLLADNKTNGRTMLCFSGNYVHIALHTGRDLFEVKKESEIKDPVALKGRLKGELRYVTGILDELLCNENLF